MLDYSKTGADSSATDILARTAAVALALLIGLAGVGSLIIAGGQAYTLATWHGPTRAPVFRAAIEITTFAVGGAALFALSVRALQGALRRRE